jgi:hypothetical protein
MLTAMQQNWWVLVLRGLLSIVFGILVLVWPGIALESLILLVAAYFLIDGVVEIITFIQRRAVNPQWLWGVLEGVVSVLAGIGAFLFPGITALILLYLIAVYAIMTGVLQLIAAWQLRKEIEGEIWLGLGDRRYSAHSFPRHWRAGGIRHYCRLCDSVRHNPDCSRLPAAQFTHLFIWSHEQSLLVNANKKDAG